MRFLRHLLPVFLVTIVVGAGPEAGCFIRVHAQGLDPTGHWEGTIPVPDNPVDVAFDISRDANGALMGTFDSASENVHGLLLQTVLLEGHTLTLIVREDQPFSGALSDDGKTVKGVLSSQGYDIPITLERNGDAHVEPPVKSAAVDARLVGKWFASTPMGPISLLIANHADGTAAAELINEAEGGLRIPARTITAKGAHVTLDLPAVGGAYEGDVDEAGTEIAGAYSQGAQTAPITFKKTE
jgi:hypothetical protein